MTLRFGEAVLIRIQFHQTTGAKVRPAVVFLDTMTVLPKADIVRSLGMLSVRDREPLVEVLCRAFCRKT